VKGFNTSMGQNLVVTAAGKLQGLAASWWQRQMLGTWEEDHPTWEEFCVGLEAAFPPPDFVARLSLFRGLLRKGCTVEQYCASAEDADARVPDGDMPPSLKIVQLLEGLQEPRLGYKATRKFSKVTREGGVMTLQDMLQYVLELARDTSMADSFVTSGSARAGGGSGGGGGGGRDGPSSSGSGGRGGSGGWRGGGSNSSGGGWGGGSRGGGGSSSGGGWGGNRGGGVSSSSASGINALTGQVPGSPEYTGCLACKSQDHTVRECRDTAALAALRAKQQQQQQQQRHVHWQQEQGEGRRPSGGGASA
jgi:hypothetical protein